jgi:hypothetical protein
VLNQRRGRSYPLASEQSFNFKRVRGSLPEVMLLLTTYASVVLSATTRARSTQADSSSTEYSRIVHGQMHERLRISERTKAGLRQARREGKVLGRPRVHVDVHKVHRMQADGMSLRKIAASSTWSLSSIMVALRKAKLARAV